ncbi:1-phosphofructokinase family hexose kinase [Amycolatopsis marina]|nr:PfkB family carbohydrate kinase [Amycolatopsis marina]
MDGRVMVFAPSPLLTVTVEDLGGEPDLHLHAGGQGVWQARMIASLGVPVALCAALGGEVGQVLRHLLGENGIEHVQAPVTARNGAYVHDRRSEERQEIADVPGDPLSRHELDAVYETALLQGIRSTVSILSGPSDRRTVPAEVYRRLAADLRSNGCVVVADLAGERLNAVLEGGLDLVKVSHEELLDDGRADSEDAEALVRGMRSLRDEGAETVVLSRADDPALILAEGEVWEAHMPRLHPVDPRGAGDSMTGAIAAELAVGTPLKDAIKVGAAAGALNVTRHGLGSSSGPGVRELAELVELRSWGGP